MKRFLKDIIFYCIIIKIGENLREYNFNKLINFFDKEKQELFKKLNKSFANELNHFVEVLASSYCPEVILIMNHDDHHENYKRLFDYINFLTCKSIDLDKRINKVKKDAARRQKELKKWINNTSQKK